MSEHKNFAPNERRLHPSREKSRATLCAADILMSFAAASLGWLLCVRFHVVAPAQSIVATAVVFALSAAASGCYRDTVRFVEYRDIVRMFLAATTGALAGAIGTKLFPAAFGDDASLPIFVGFIIIGLWIAARVALATLASRQRRPLAPAQRTIIVGAGSAARSLIDVVRSAQALPFQIVGCVDSEFSPASVNGVPFLGDVSELEQFVARYDVECVIVAIPSAPLAFVNKIIALCAHARSSSGKAPSVKVLPGASELLNGGVKISRLRDVQLEDLLDREPVRIDLSAVAPHLTNQVVLVTGAGGSIGSELCRQIAAFQPRLLVLLGHGENSLFAIEQELRYSRAFTRTQLILADVADAPHIRSVFSKYRPHIVFHAAAHKHVPILENNVCEAVRNNVLGTHLVALAAAAAGVAKFVLLSTDKAVNPTSVMGTTKRIAELIVQSFAHQTSTEFACVRFGNVLGSRGSVLPIFKRQLEAGGPITVTHRDMQRYFMTIPEAVSLVLQAMSMGRDGQVFVLDMGAPVKIIRLAEMVVTLSGLTPYRDIDIVETGIRPGEKLFEEILTSQEGISKSTHERLFIAQQERMDYEVLASSLRAMLAAIQVSDAQRLLAIMCELVPSFSPGAHFSVNGPGNVAPGAAIKPLPARTNGVREKPVIDRGTIALDDDDATMLPHLSSKG